MRFKCLMAILVAFSLTQMSTASIVISGSAPTNNIASDGTGAINSNLFDFSANANNVRGQLFSLGDNPTGTQYQIDSITIQKNNTNGEQTGSVGGSISYVDSVMNLWLFEGDLADFTAGSGRTTDTNPLTGTNTTQLYNEAFSMTSLTIGDDEFVTFEFTTPVIVNDNSDFGFVLDYDQNNSAPDRFGYSENGNGNRLSVDNDSHNGSTRGVHYYVSGSPISVPEPGSLAILAIGSLGLIARRRKS